MRLLLSLFLCLFSFISQATAPVERQTINVKRFDTNDGFNQNIVLSLISDKYQRAWIGTQNGINIVHGKQVLSIKHNAQNENSLSANIINDFAIADDGNIWVATSNGVDKVLVDSLQVAQKIQGFPEGSSKDIRQIKILNGYIFLASYHGIFRLKANNNQVENYYPYTKVLNKSTIADSSRPLLKVLDKHRMVIGSNHGAYIVNTQNMSFELIKSSKQWPIIDILIDDKAIWLATKNSGLREINKQTLLENSNKFSQSQYRHLTINKLAKFNQQLLLNSNTGLLSYHVKTQEIKEIYLKSVNRESTEQIIIYSHLVYQDDTLLLGTKKGLFQLSKSAFSITSLPVNTLKNITIESAIADLEQANTIWFVSDTSLYKWKFEGSATLKTAFNNSNVTNYFIRIFQNQQYIFLSEFDNGIHLFDKQSQKMLTLKHNHTDKITVYDLFETAPNTFLAATSFGLREIVLKHDELLMSKPLINSSDNSFFSIKQLGDYYLLGSRFSGLWIAKQNQQSKQIEKVAQFKQPTMITSIYVDQIQRAWVQTADHGIYHLSIKPSDKQSKSKQENASVDNKAMFDFRPFEHNALLPNQTPVCIAQDNNDNTWIGTLDGLSLYNSQTNHIATINTKQGISSNDFGQASCGTTKQGKVFFGSESDINVISSELALSPPKIISPHLMRISSGKQRFSGTDENIVIKESPIIHLNFISQPEYLFSNVVYFFRLVGQHNDWVQTAEPETVYTNLSAGDYTFEVYAKYQNQAPSKTISKSITITTLWYKTKLAKVVYIITALFILAVMVYLKIRTSQLALDLENQKNKSLTQYSKELEQQVNSRTQALAQKTLDAEKANQDKTRFIASASHDIRHPLNAAKLMLEHYKNETSVVDEKKLINNLDININSLSRLIESILDLSKLDAKDFKPYISTQHAQDWLQVLITDLALLANHESVSFISEIDKAFLQTDFLLVERVIRNLAQNAIEITPEGKKVMLQGKVIGSIYRIEIIDQGPGIPEQMMEKIFQPFVTYQPKGTGLGLTIAQQICQNLNLNLQISSSNKGAQFSLDIPISTAIPAVPKEALVSPSQVSIWAIDDDCFSLNALTSLLESWKINVRAINTPEELNALSKQCKAPDIFIADFHLSEHFNAKSLMEQYAEYLENSQIIVVSAEQNVRELVDVPFLLKPIHPAKLKKLIFNYLKHN